MPRFWISHGCEYATVNAFINSQFTYTRLIWMFAGKSAITKNCKIHFRTPQINYNNYDKSYHDLSNFSIDVSIHQQYWSLSITYGYEFWVHVEILSKNPVPQNLRKGDIVSLPPAGSSSCGINSLAFRGSLIGIGFPVIQNKIII